MLLPMNEGHSGKVDGPTSSNPGDHGDLLERIDRRLAVLERRTAWLDELGAAPAVVATLVDTFDQFADGAQRAGVDLDEVVPGLRDLALRITVAAQQSQGARRAPGGIFGLLGELRDPEVRTSLGVLLEFAKQFARARTVADAALVLPERERSV
jgi:hypothetical protein